MKPIGIALLALFTSLSPTTCLKADESAVRKTLTDYVDVFNKKDAGKIAQFWTENGTHTDRETGDRTEGRDAIAADMEEVFDAQSSVKLTATIERLKFITSDVASVEGETTVAFSEDEPIVSTFSAILVHEGDKWLLDSIEEMPLPIRTSSTALKELEWLIGDWVDDSGDVKVATTFRWTHNQAFLLRSFNVQTEEGIAMSGTQVIGWDPVVQQIRGWSFNSDGSFGSSSWSHNGDTWVSKSIQTSASGETASGTYIMERMSNDAFTLQLVGHEADGRALPTGPAVKVVRAAQSTTETTPTN